MIYIQNLVLYLHISLAGHQKCSTWYLYFYLYLYLYLNIHFWKFVKAKTEQVLISLGDLCQIDCNLSLCCLFCLMECPDMLATCKLSVKQTISESNNSIMAAKQKKSSLSVFVFILSTRSSKQELVMLYPTFRLLCVLAYFILF